MWNLVSSPRHKIAHVHWSFEFWISSTKSVHTRISQSSSFMSQEFRGCAYLWQMFVQQTRITSDSFRPIRNRPEHSEGSRVMSACCRQDMSHVTKQRISLLKTVGSIKAWRRSSDLFQTKVLQTGDTRSDLTTKSLYSYGWTFENMTF